MPDVSGIDQRWQLFDTAPSLVEDRFNDMKSFASDGYNMAMQAIQRLSHIAEQLHLINKVITIDTEVIPNAALEDLIPPTIDLDKFRIDIPSLPTEPSLIDATLESIPTGFPEMIGPGEITPGSQSYVSPLLTALKSKILSDLQNGSIGLTDAVQDAIFYKEYERSLLELEDEKDRIRANWAKGGFPFPNSGLQAALKKVDDTFTNKRLDVSRDIAIKSFELALQNSHFIIQQGLHLEVALISWANQVATRVYEASKAVAESQIKSYEARVKGFGERVRIIIEKCKAKIEYNIGIIRMYEASVSAYGSRMRAEGDRVTAVARGYEAQTSVFNSQLNFEVQKVLLDLKVIQARIDQAVANAGIMIKDKEVEIKNYEMLMTLMVEAIRAEGNIAAQVASGALAAVHASVQIGASDSASYNYSPVQAKTTTRTSVDAEGNETSETTETS